MCSNSQMQLSKMNASYCLTQALKVTFKSCKIWFILTSWRIKWKYLINSAHASEYEYLVNDDWWVFHAPWKCVNAKLGLSHVYLRTGVEATVSDVAACLHCTVRGGADTTQRGFCRGRCGGIAASPWHSGHQIQVGLPVRGHNTSRNHSKWEQPRWRKGERRFNSLDLVYLIIGFGFITSRMTPRHWSR